MAGEFAELGLVVEQFELARPAGHEQEDDALRLGAKCGGDAGPWGSSREAFLSLRAHAFTEERRQTDRAEAERQLRRKIRGAWRLGATAVVVRRA